MELSVAKERSWRLAESQVFPVIESIGIPLECFKMPRRFAPTPHFSRVRTHVVGNLAGIVERTGEHPAAEPLHNTPTIICVHSTSQVIDERSVVP